MKPTHFALLLVLPLLGCGGESRPIPSGPSRTPVSVRGWIADIVPPGAPRPTDPGKLASWMYTMFQDTSVVVLNIPYASGGFAGNGSFIVLDVPPGAATLDFTSPGIPTAKLTLRGLPPNADVLLPGLVLTGGAVTILHPEKVMVRVPAESATARRKLPGKVMIGSLAVEAFEVPLTELADRRDYPTPFMVHPLATVR